MVQASSTAIFAFYIKKSLDFPSIVLPYFAVIRENRPTRLIFLEVVSASLRDIKDFLSSTSTNDPC